MATRRNQARYLGGTMVLMVLLLAPMPAQSDSLDELAAKLVSLRGKVEELNSELKSLREQHKNEMGSLSRRKSELESTVQKREVSLDELRKSLEEKRKKARQAGVQGESLKPVLMAAIKDLKARVKSGLPFKVDKRLGEIGEIEDRLASGVLSPHKAAKQLWSFYEDEVRLAEGSGLYKQTVTVAGEDRLADVARIGMVMMYFRTPDEQYGRVVREANGWQYEVIQDTASKERVKDLFASFRKQVRTGYFALPNALTGMEELQ